MKKKKKRNRKREKKKKKKDVTAAIPPQELAQTKDLDMALGELSVERALGVQWACGPVHTPRKNRSFRHCVETKWVGMKLFLLTFCQNGESWLRDLPHLAALKIPRSYLPLSFGESTQYELHSFSADFKSQRIRRLLIPQSNKQNRTDQLLTCDRESKSNSYQSNDHPETQSCHQRSENNPADYASRGLSAVQLKESNWLKGPDFLWQSNLPLEEEMVGEVEANDPELRKAEACKSVEYAIKKCPNGMYSEIKYDGERVQVHKNGENFSYFSRSLKPVLPHKVAHFKEFIPQAFPGGHSMILDAEVLLIDTKTSKPLPFGTLGVHKKTAFQDANVCLFVFDCMYFNGVSLMERPLCERRKFLHDNMVEVPNRILFSEMKHVTRAADLADMITRVIREGLEGLVLKDIKGSYKPGKRHWLKVKKDYLNEGAMADTADLVVLGAFYGKGSNGGIMSSFLMGCYDPDSKKWCTVTKCSGGYDDATLARLQKELDVIKISKEPGKIPSWLKIIKNYYPDFIIRDPEQAPVWEITGAEFSKSEMHTADGISIRFPRMTRIRDEKNWKSTTNLHKLKELYRISKENCDFQVKKRENGHSNGQTKTTAQLLQPRNDKVMEQQPSMVFITCDVKVTGLKSFSSPGRGFLGTGMMQDVFHSWGTLPCPSQVEYALGGVPAPSHRPSGRVTSSGPAALLGPPLSLHRPEQLWIVMDGVRGEGGGVFFFAGVGLGVGGWGLL
ncbi:hypothetical protein L3Q82_015464 [Scortum barcoo]|uniref:Uncharacterized protein n=1 Tax=Scortum barcoo TaxID=214431 RepID=A0ACB8VNI3_9TELE|nr:hypothetical protein L3Q82_015464 [Scortum barcoo]